MLAKSCRSADMRDYHKVKLGNDFRWRQAHNVKFAVGQEVSERIGLDKLISIYDGSKEVPFFV
ncbi:hypothetical protein PS865_04397 [Pseudomonas fluorescens]|nr:hypothetical protein PS865_04397 [Pseudomonas fluorescens]